MTNEMSKHLRMMSYSVCDVMLQHVHETSKKDIYEMAEKEYKTRTTVNEVEPEIKEFAMNCIEHRLSR